MNFLLTSMQRGVYSAGAWEKVGDHGWKNEVDAEAHLPVLPSEVLSWLRPGAGSIMLDCTVGYCGHARAILESSAPDGTVIGIDRDEAAITSCKKRLERFGSRLVLIKGHFLDLKRHLADLGISKVNGVLFDLGVSSPQLDDPSRGFSFQTDGPLDMRMDQTEETTAADIVNRMGEADLANMIYEFGEERLSRRIARAIIRARTRRPLETTRELVSAIEGAVPGSYRRGRIHFATRTFQALRIAVNQELDHLASALCDAADVLEPGGRLCVISFHSLEDRIVKQTFRRLSGAQLTVLTKKPQLPTRDEMKSNPRSRSAKLRVAERHTESGHA